ncbi:MAG: helix-turn-helix domain-containing protein [Candidatus Acidiferrales bacterium]
MEERTQEVTPREMAQRLGIRLDTAYGLIWAGRIAANKRDGRWLISSEAVEARAKQRQLKAAA